MKNNIGLWAVGIVLGLMLAMAKIVAGQLGGMLGLSVRVGGWVLAALGLCYYFWIVRRRIM